MNPIKKLHAGLIVSGLYKHPLPASKVLTAYALSPSHLSDAHKVFDQIEKPTTSICNRTIKSFSQTGPSQHALLLYTRMRARAIPPDSHTFTFILKACARLDEIRYGAAVHSTAMKLGMVVANYVSNALIHLYCTFQDLGCAKMVFDEMPVRDLVSWNSLICGFSKKACFRDVLKLFEEMRVAEVQADAVTMVKVVLACMGLGEWGLADSMVRYIQENQILVDVYLGNSMINLYGRRGLAESAERVFNMMEVRNIVTFNLMITVYAKAGNFAAALDIFNVMPERDLVSWNSMIAGYSQANKFLDALLLFEQMQRANVRPDELVLVSVLSACAHLGALSQGEWIHDYIVNNNIRADVYVGNSLIDMYAKCGCVLRAFDIFKEMKEKDTLSWNSIIVGFANNGYVRCTFEVFGHMFRQGYKPNEVTFVGLLIACAHNGLVDKGLKVFEIMKQVYQVEPTMKHYGCVVGLLGRAGELEKAHKFIREMSVRPGPIVWRIMLGACRTHGNVNLAEIATRELNELDPRNSGNYVLLSNAYAAADRWKDSMEVRDVMVENDMQITPGSSSIEVSYLQDESKDSEFSMTKI